jgi:ribosomal protein S21
VSKNKCVNIEVKLRDGESSDRLIKRFFKKCKKQDIVREYCEKTEFYRTKSQKRRDKIRKNKFYREREQTEFVDESQ